MTKKSKIVTKANISMSFINVQMWSTLRIDIQKSFEVKVNHIDITIYFLYISMALILVPQNCVPQCFGFIFCKGCCIWKTEAVHKDAAC